MTLTQPRPLSVTGSDRTVAIRTLFTITAFLGAALLFVVQPLITKLLLPSYGGSATVWSTSSLFFQVLLLGAYLYVHVASRRLGQRWQPRLHLPLLALPLLVLPVALPADAAPSGDSSPALWLLRTLVLMIGLPFAVVATPGPVLQRWFSWTDDPRAHDPYFLFAASNLGSFVGLLAYPFVIEPTMSLDAQRTSWSIGFGIFALLTAACGLIAARTPLLKVVDDVTPESRLGARRVATWAVLAFLPSSLMLAITAHVSTDVAAIPLLWVLPLATYLATFVAAFARRSREAPTGAVRLSIALTMVAASLSFMGGLSIWLTIPPVLALLAAVGYAAHTRLACDRPDPSHLTTFYLVIAIGGALGGLLNGLLAPLVFDRVLEYPLTLVLVPLVLAGLTLGRRGLLERRYHPGFAAFLITAAALGILMFQTVGIAGAAKMHLGIGLAALLTAVALCWGLATRPAPMSFALAVMFVVGSMVTTGGTIEHSRSFFGAYRITESDDSRSLVHGNTVHGRQLLARPDQATTYYASSGSVGDVMEQFGDRFTDMGMVGLGVGTLAAYGQPGQHMTFFEIDQQIVDLAEDPELFTFLSDSQADVTTVVGDGRLKVEGHDSGSFDLLVLDAFSSDSIPVHLLTREAFRMYADRLREGGVLVVHVSNRVFDLRPIVAAAADDLGWEAVEGRGDGSVPGSVRSQWVVLSSDPEVTGTLAGLPNWRPLGLGDQTVWTDDYSSVLSVLR